MGDSTPQGEPAARLNAEGRVRTAFSTSRVVLLVAAFSLGLLLFLSIEPTEPWILLVVTAVVAIGADGILRDHPIAAFEDDIAWTAPFLFLPTMLALASGLFLEDAISGYWVLPGVLIVAALMGSVLFAGQASVDQDGPLYPASRFILNIGTYLTAFGLLAVHRRRPAAGLRYAHQLDLRRDREALDDNLRLFSRRAHGSSERS